jgi:hypothetical protein
MVKHVERDLTLGIAERSFLLPGEGGSDIGDLAVPDVGEHLPQMRKSCRHLGAASVRFALGAREPYC